MKFVYFVKKEVVIIEIWFLKNEAPQIWNFLSNLQKWKTVSKVNCTPKVRQKNLTFGVFLLWN